MPRKYALGREDDHRPCLRCQDCGGKGSGGEAVLHCAVNPVLGYDTEFPLERVPPAIQKKRVAVVGGGPAGVQSMLTLIERGHDVTLYEKSDRIGGNIIHAAHPWYKDDMRDYLNYLQVQAAKAPARVLMNTEATAETLAKENYDALIIAVGADPFIPNIPGINLEHVCWAPEAEADMSRINGNVIIAGAGMVGVECALHLAKGGIHVELVELAPNLDNLRKDCGACASDLLRMLDEYNVPVHLENKLVEITQSEIICESPSGAKKYKADAVLLALGMRARHEPVDSLRRIIPETEVFVVGDALKATALFYATASAFKAAAYI
jgi:NADPH-dependent 2,4-dienoyl-CoA reductase/sulfur reductase-like enzyme